MHETIDVIANSAGLMMDRLPITDDENGGKAVPSPHLGTSLRAVRQRNGWSLAEVSAKTGLATSTLSRIENNRLSLTYEKLLQLSRGLEIDLAELLSNEPPQAGGMPTGRRAVTLAGEGRVIETEVYHYRYLCTDLVGKKMTPIFGSTTATSIEQVGGFLRHEGEELVFVLTGTLEVHTEFYEPVQIDAGGCVYFDSRMGHAFLSVNGGPVTFLSVTSAPQSGLREAALGRMDATMLESRSAS